jgi:hypothetical protein
MIFIRKHNLIIIMSSCYLLPFYKIYLNYENNYTISNILNNENNKNIILFYSLPLCITTVIYENIYRTDIYSSISIYFILTGIFPVILINENCFLHYFFATQVFISILYFMTRNCLIYKRNILLLFSLFWEFKLFFYILFNFKNKNIFYSESYFIINFAFYYLHLHFIS